MQTKKIKTRTEFYFFNRNQTIVLDEPAEIIFINVGAVGDRIVINNNLTLDSHQTATSVGSQFPSTYTIRHNPNEIDVTNYTIRFTTLIDPRLFVICKYYVND
jgi:hypothetical protein